MLRFLLHILGVVVGYLPLPLSDALGSMFGLLMGRVIRFRRVEVLDTLSRCLPERSDTECRRIADDMYANFGLNLVETLRLAYGRPDPLLAKVRVLDREIVEEALANEKGVLILTAHLGNWEMLAVAATREGFPSSIVVKEIKGVAINDLIVRMRERFGTGLVPQRNAYRQCLRVLKKNQLLGFMLDQNMIRDEGVFVDFFGKPACTTPGLAHLAAHSGAVVVPAFAVRREADRGLDIQVLPPLPAPADRSPEAIQEATQLYTGAVEDMIRRYPGQWNWIHRRWRTRPLAYAEVE